MSDLQTNIEIEDVLASIRRLVSDGDPSSAAETADSAKPTSADVMRPSVSVPVSAPVETANSSAPPEKFVLSPELLVQPPTDTAISTSEVGPVALEEEPAEVEVTLAEPPLVLMPSDTAQSGDDESPNDVAADTEPFDKPRVADMWHLSRAEQDEPSSPAAAEADVEVETRARRRDSAARTRLLSTIEELEAAVKDTDDFEPDGSESTPIVDWTQTQANGAIFGTRNAAAHEEAAVENDQEPVPLTSVSDVNGAQSDEDTIDNIADAIVDTESEAFAARVDADLKEYLNADTVVDEAALREMVTDIVRQELQGALGERITRNVRKLVRREIYRALASEEFN